VSVGTDVSVAVGRDVDVGGGELVGVAVAVVFAGGMIGTALWLTCVK
jgi:hypothetical protein